MSGKLTHTDLVRKAKSWLAGTMGCTVVMSDLRTQNTEIPDGLGFKGTGGFSILVECKTSRSDFHSDKNKIFRRNPWQGMGNLRYFMAPQGILKPDDIEDPWGLVEVSPGKAQRAKVVKKAIPVDEANKIAEVIVLVSAIRRLEISTAVFVRGDI